MLVVFTDLDGTLLERETYSCESARPTLERLARRSIPVVFCTSKTRAETEAWRVRLENRHPFIVENGGAAFVPRGYFPYVAHGVPRDRYEVIEFGDPYDSLVAALEAASAATGVRVRGFHQMSTEEVAERTGLGIEEARLATQREYDEPFEIPDPAGTSALLREIERLGKRWTKGGRFYHVTGGSDKAGAVVALRDAYLQIHQKLVTVGLGDGLNDAEFLRVVDIPYLVQSPHTDELRARVPGGRATSAPGPEGWRQAILEVVPE